MMFTIIILMELIANSVAVITISATVPHADIRHFRGPVASGSATQESLHQATEEASKRVHEAAAAARKIAHGDGSDSFANYLEQSMMKLQKEDEELHERAEERIAQHELDRKVEQQVKHAHEVAHQRALHMTSDEAFQQLHETVEGIRKKAHGDGSDSWANELEQSMEILEEEKHENEFKAHERHVKHEHDREMREELLQAQQAKANTAVQGALGKEHNAKNSDEAKNPDEAAKQMQVAAEEMRQAAHGDGSDRWANQLEESVLDLEAEKQDFEQKARLRRAKHKLENEVNEGLLHAMQPISVAKRSQKFLARNDHIVQQPVYADEKQEQASQLPGLEDGYTNSDIVQTGAGLAFFLCISLVVFVGLSWQRVMNSYEPSYVVPGLGKVDIAQSERMMRGLLKGVVPNAGLAVYGDETRAAAPLKSAFSSPKGATPYFTL
jgi:hypothetical protein